MNTNVCVLRLAVVYLFLAVQAFSAVKGDAEYVGQFDTTLVAGTERLERIVFKPVSGSDVRSSKPFSESAHITMNRIANPTGQASLVAILVEDGEEKPAFFIDLNADNSFSDNEKIVFEQEEKDNPFLWKATVNLPVKDSFFTAGKVFLRFFKNYRTAKMTDGERLIQQSTELFARGTVDVKGKKVLVQYAYSFENKKIAPDRGWLGVDADENGEIDMDSLSPEAARANGETIVFRIGQSYISTKKADVVKNQIVMREHQAKDYKRTELGVGKELPDFSFVDLNGKKRKLSEFRGKYVLLDFWGFWCPPCREELPYLREAYKRFQSRNLEIVGMNTDDYTPESIKKSLEENGMTWTQARQDSFVELKDFEFRIESFPTTFLLSPDGKILSMSRQDKGEPDLRGRELLTTLDEILPKK